MKQFLTYIIVIIVTTFSCSQNHNLVDDIENIPELQPEDEKYSGVFKSLDGTWKGEFLIYEDQNQQPKNEVELHNISFKDFERPSLKLVNSIDVQQIYTSETPYFQRVTITDFYPDKNEKVVSRGVNKIQDGQMWCVVKKPNETIIHKGEYEGNTIIWSRDENSPQRVEYFKETVLENSYEILGWGYYEGDDLSLSPKLWFYAKYQRQKE